MAEIVKVAVVGGGSFGTVMANIAAGNGFPVSFWMRSDALAAAINRDHVNESTCQAMRLTNASLPRMIWRLQSLVPS